MCDKCHRTAYSCCRCHHGLLPSSLGSGQSLPGTRMMTHLCHSPPCCPCHLLPHSPDTASPSFAFLTPLTAAAFQDGAFERFLCNNHCPHIQIVGLGRLVSGDLLGNGFWAVGHRPSTGSPLCRLHLPGPSHSQEPGVYGRGFGERHILRNILHFCKVLTSIYETR